MSFTNVQISRSAIAIAVSLPVTLVAGYTAYKLYQRLYTYPNQIDGIGIGKDKSTVRDLKERGNIYFRKKDYENALACYNDCLWKIEKEEASRKNANLSDALDNSSDALKAILYSNLAAVHECSGLWQECLSASTSAIECNKFYSKPYSRRATAREHFNDIDGMLEDLATVAILSPSQTHLREKIDAVIASIADGRTSDLLKTKKIIKISPYTMKRFATDIFPDDIFSQKDISRMEEEFEGSDLLPAYLHNLKLALDGEIEDVRSWCGQQTSEWSSSTIGQWNILQHRVLLLQLTMAFAAVDNYMIKDLGDKMWNCKTLEKSLLVGSRVRVVAERMLEMDMEGGLAIVQDILGLDPQRATTYFYLGQIFLLTQSYDQAIEFTQKAIELDTTNNPIINAQWLILRAQKAQAIRDTSGIEEVLREFEELVNKHPNSAEINTHHAELLFELGDKTKAEAYLKAGLELADDMTKPYIYTQLAVRYLQDNNLERAKETLLKAVAIDEYSDTCRQLYAVTLYKMGDIPGAIEQLEKNMEMIRGYGPKMMSMCTLIAMTVQKKIMDHLNLDQDSCKSFTNHLIGVSVPA